MAKMHYTEKLNIGGINLNTPYCGQNFFFNTPSTDDISKVTCKNCLNKMKRNKIIE